MWIAFAVAIPVTLAYPPLLAVPRSFDTHGLHPGLTAMPAFYSTLFRTAITPMILAAVAAYVPTRRDKRREDYEPLLPRHESAALIGFAVAPIILLAAVTFAQNLSFSERYGLFCVIGVACCAAVLIFRAAAGNRRTGAIFAAALVGWLILARGREAAGSTVDPRTGFQSSNPLLLQALAGGRPVVANDPITFLPADFYLSNAALANLYHVVHLAGATRYVGQDASDRQMLIMAQLYPFRGHVEPWTTFLGAAQAFLASGQRAATAAHL